MESSAVQCSAVQCSTVQYSAAQCRTVQYNTVQRFTSQCNTPYYSVVQQSTVQHITVQHIIVQHSIVQHTHHSTAHHIPVTSSSTLHQEICQTLDGTWTRWTAQLTTPASGSPLLLRGRTNTGTRTKLTHRFHVFEPVVVQLRGRHLPAPPLEDRFESSPREDVSALCLTAIKRWKRGREEVEKR